MKKHLVLMIILSSFAQSLNAESFTYKAGETYFATSLYNSFGRSQRSSGVFDDDSGKIYRIKTASQRIAQTFDYQYGYRDDLTLFTKFDVGFERHKLFIQYNNPSVEPTSQFFSLNTDYSRILPEIGFRKRLQEDEKQLIANRWTYYPGDLIFSKNRSYHIHRNSAIGTRLQYAQKFDAEFFWSKYFKDYRNKEYGHYFEWEAGINYFPEAKRFEFPLDMRFYLSAGANWGFGMTLYNIFNHYYSDDKPFNNSLLTANIRNFTNMTADDQNNLLNQVESLRKPEGSNHSHQLNLKVDYYITRIQTIGLEASTNVFAEKSFQNNAILINYSLYF